MVKGHYLATLIVLMIASSATASAYSISANGLNFIASHEGTILTLYNDPAGHCTIGVGHLVHTGNCDGSDPSEQGYLGGITNDQAQELLRLDVASAEQTVNSLVTVPLTQAQFNALVDFTYNVGAGNFERSDLLTKLNAGQYDAVPQELNKWVYGGGEILPGLVTRRSDEGNLFQSEGVAPTNAAVAGASNTAAQGFGNSIVGKWTINYDWGCGSSTYKGHGTFELNFKGDGTFFDDAHQTGKWTRNGDNIHIVWDAHPAVYEGTIQMNTMSGVITQDSPPGCWSASKD